MTQHIKLKNKEHEPHENWGGISCTFGVYSLIMSDNGLVIKNH